MLASTNAYGQTAVAPYSPRARDRAPVAVPLDFDELGTVAPDRFDLDSARRRIARKPDPWAHIGDHPADARAVLRELRPARSRRWRTTTPDSPDDDWTRLQEAAP